MASNKLLQSYDIYMWDKNIHAWQLNRTYLITIRTLLNQTNGHSVIASCFHNEAFTVREWCLQIKWLIASWVIHQYFLNYTNQSVFAVNSTSLTFKQVAVFFHNGNNIRKVGNILPANYASDKPILMQHDSWFSPSSRSINNNHSPYNIGS